MLARRHAALPLLAILLVVSPAVRAQDPAPAGDDTTGAPPNQARLFPPSLRRGDTVYLPQVRYAEETGPGAGLKILHRFRGAPEAAEAASSEILLKGIFTLKGQQKIELTGQRAWRAGAWSLKVKADYDDLATRFWGVGPDTPGGAEEAYRPRSLTAYLELFRRLVDGLRVGGRLEYQRLELLDVAPGGVLAAGRLRGTDGRGVLGAGIVADWDTTDRRYSPTRGRHWQAFALMFDDKLGNTDNFDVWHVDLRQYLLLAPGHVLALQAFTYTADGDAPFWRLAALGGREHTRGYRRGRYLDHTLVALQAEYRFPLWKRLGMVAFGGVGDVAPRPGLMQLEHMRPTLGTGLRLATGGDDDVRARLDVAAGQHSLRLYLSLGEAF